MIISALLRGNQRLACPGAHRQVVTQLGLLVLKSKFFPYTTLTTIKQKTTFKLTKHKVSLINSYKWLTIKQVVRGTKTNNIYLFSLNHGDYRIVLLTLRHKNMTQSLQFCKWTFHKLENKTFTFRESLKNKVIK